jgi:hypothetical protein
MNRPDGGSQTGATVRLLSSAVTLIRLAVKVLHWDDFRTVAEPKGLRHGGAREPGHGVIPRGLCESVPRRPQTWSSTHLWTMKWTVTVFDTISSGVVWTVTAHVVQRRGLLSPRCVATAEVLARLVSEQFHSVSERSCGIAPDEGGNHVARYHVLERVV